MLAVVGLIFAGTFIIGVPVAFALGLAGTAYIVFWEGLPLSLPVRRIYFMLSNFQLLSIPLFIMIGYLAERTGLLPRLLNWLQVLVGWMKGGVAYINVLASMTFAGVSGTAVSDVASLGRIEIEMMRRAGYDHGFTCALTAATSTMGPIIPPSVAMVIYALAVGNISIGGLFLAGALPGFLIGVVFLLYAFLMTRKGNYAWERGVPRAKEVLIETVRVSPLLGLPLIIVGGIVGGFVTVTESAAIGVVYTILIGFTVTRELHARDIAAALLYSAKTSSVVAMLMGAGAIISWLMSRNLVTEQLTDFMIDMSDEATLFMVVVLVTLVLVGMIMEATAVMITLGPLLAPVALQYGIPDLQFGLVFTMTVLLGMITPPVGIILFLTASIGGISLERLSWAIVPLVLAEMCVILLVIYFPPLTMWLPRLFGF
jgi:tripartite ATP-independent transporter DctM subunit